MQPGQPWPKPSFPSWVCRYLERSLPGGGAVPRQVRVRQEGEMWLQQGGCAMRFTATVLFAVERVAFAWQARFPILGPLAIKVVDGYADGGGELVVRVLGLPMQRQQGPAAAGEDPGGAGARLLTN